MPEAVNAGESQPDDLRSALAAALAEHDTPSEPAPKIEAKAAPEVPAETEQGEAAAEVEDKEQTRGADGKFVGKDAAESAEEPEAQAEPEKKPEGLEAPTNWAAKDKELFKAQSPEAQRFLLDRVKSMEGDYTKKTEAIAALKREYEPIDKLFEPYRDAMKQRGFTPRSLIEAWANVERKLAENPVEVIKGLVAGYRVNPAQLANVLGISPAAEGEAPTVAPTVQLPPELIAELNSLRQTVTGLTQTQQQAQQAARNASEARVQSDIEAFKSAKDDKGNLVHPHFDEIEQDMTALALVARQMGQPVPSLKDLYERAANANPSTREKLRTAERQQAEEQRKVEARAKAAAAKKAASSVTGAPGPGQAPDIRMRAEKTLREQLEDAAADSFAAA
jgi:hypothetical protein